MAIFTRRRADFLTFQGDSFSTEFQIQTNLLFDDTGTPLRNFLRRSLAIDRVLVDSIVTPAPSDELQSFVEKSILLSDTIALDDTTLFADEFRNLHSVGWIESPVKIVPMSDEFLTPNFIRNRIL